MVHLVILVKLLSLGRLRGKAFLVNMFSNLHHPNLYYIFFSLQNDIWVLVNNRLVYYPISQECM